MPIVLQGFFIQPPQGYHFKRIDQTLAKRGLGGLAFSFAAPFSLCLLESV